MARKQEPEEHGESAPLWIISFADLVVLMLSFFVILAAGNNKDTSTDPEFAKVVASIKAAFHNMSNVGPMPFDPKADFDGLVRKLMALQKTETGRRGDADNKGVYGKHFRVTRIRDGLEVCMGGPVFFEPFSVKPTEEGQRQLQDVLQIVKGRRNIIEIRGHVGETPWPSDWDYDHVMKLAYDRAEYVGHVLRKAGVDPRAIRLVAVGPNEPLKGDLLKPATTSENRRVEIVVRESMIDDYVKETPANRNVSEKTAASRPARAIGH